MSEKMWAIMVQLSNNQWSPMDEELIFDEDFWGYILDECVKTGVNTILMDVGDGVCYKSHPEISVKNAWSREKVLQEVNRCRSMGITLIPKLNFSTKHDMWLKEYHKMVSTSIYYDVCKDLISEVYDMFAKPPYIHLGMDEEGYRTAKIKDDYVVYRKGKLLVDDLKFLIDTVKDLGATPWIWHDVLTENTELYLETIAPEDALISPWYYDAINPEHFAPLYPGEPDGSKNELYQAGYRYVEEIYNRVNFREKIAPLIKKGFKYVPATSVWSKNPYNADEVREYFQNADPEGKNIIGFMSAPWAEMTWESKEKYDKTFLSVKKEMELFFI